MPRRAPTLDRRFPSFNNWPVRPWSRDPVVWAAVVIGALANGLALFGGRYLPFNDWASHVGLSAVLAHGAETGADAYLTRDFTPTPYLLFYLVTAGWALVTSAEVGAKLNLIL